MTLHDLAISLNGCTKDDVDEYFVTVPMYDTYYRCYFFKTLNQERIIFCNDVYTTEEALDKHIVNKIGVDSASNKACRKALYKDHVLTAQDILRMWPRVVAHLISHSLGYCTPLSAANIILDAKMGKDNWCEWLSACYNGNPRQPLRESIKYRHIHKEFMASYEQAMEIVRRDSKRQFASWI